MGSGDTIAFKAFLKFLATSSWLPARNLSFLTVQKGPLLLSINNKGPLVF